MVCFAPFATRMSPLILYGEPAGPQTVSTESVPPGTCVPGPVAAVTVTVALAFFDGSVVEVATTWQVAEAGGAEKSPEAFMGLASIWRETHTIKWEDIARILKFNPFHDEKGRFTDAGRATKARIEAQTDTLAEAPYQRLEPAEVEELVKVLEPVSSRLVAVGSDSEAVDA